MTKYHQNQKVYVKSNNNSKIILARYTYTLIAFIIVLLIINYFLKNDVISIIKSLVFSLIFSLIVTYIINVIKKKYTIKNIFVEDNAIVIGLTLGLFNPNNILILLLAVIITITIKNIFKNTNLTALLYGILLIIIYNSFKDNSVVPLVYLSQNNYQISFEELLNYGGGIYNYLFGIAYLAPALSLIIFGYLFYKKSIKYSIVIYYLLTILILSFALGAIKGCMWLPFFELTTDGLIFLTIYILADYKNSPTILETGRVYGISLGIITVLLKFIIPNFAVIVALIIGSILSKYLDKFSYKFKKYEI